MGRRKRRKNESESKSGSGWIASFADTMTLLLTFFVLLYSMADVSQDKIRALSEAFQEVLQGKSAESMLEFDKFDGSAPIVGGKEEIEIPNLNSQSQEDYTYDELKSYIENNNLQGSVSLDRNKDGVSLQLGESLLFASGESVITNKEVLSKVAQIILETESEVRIEGHTDNVPLDKNGKTNWELSVERSVNVVRFFVEEKGISADRLSAVGYGEYKPIGDNATVEGRGKNRRVSILFVSAEGE